MLLPLTPLLAALRSKKSSIPSGAGEEFRDLFDRLLAFLESKESSVTSSSEAPEGPPGPGVPPCRWRCLDLDLPLPGLDVPPISMSASPFGSRLGPEAPLPLDTGSVKRLWTKWLFSMAFQS